MPGEERGLMVVCPFPPVDPHGGGQDESVAGVAIWCRKCLSSCRVMAVVAGEKG